MLRVTRQKLRYLLGNWLDLAIVIAAAMTIAGHDAEWVAWTRLLRLAMVGMVLTRAVAELRILFSPGGLPYVFGFAVHLHAAGRCGLPLAGPIDSQLCRRAVAGVRDGRNRRLWGLCAHDARHPEPLRWSSSSSVWRFCRS